MKAPDNLNLSPEQGDALIERIEHDQWTSEDRALLVQVLRLYFWLILALQESKLSVKRLRIMIFGEPKKRRKRDADSAGDSVTLDSGGETQ